MLRRVLFALTLLFVLAGAAGVPVTDAAGQKRCNAATLAEAKAMALNAAKTLLDQGPKAAFRTFSDPNGGFIDRDLYVFIIDLQGRIWFNAVYPVVPGGSIAGSRDRKGRFFVVEMIEIATTTGEGWVEYEWLSPCSGEMEPKSTYVVRVGPLIVGVGAYGVVGL